MKAKPHERYGEARTCIWCGVDVVYGTSAIPEAATREHLRPLALDGPKTQENVATACRRCNGYRGTDETWVRFGDLPSKLRVRGRAMRFDGDCLVPAALSRKERKQWKKAEA